MAASDPSQKPRSRCRWALEIVSKLVSSLWNVLYVTMRRTSPRRTAEDDSFFLRSSESLIEHFKDVAMNPEDLLCNTVHLCVVLGASQGFLVLLHSEDLVPSSRQRKSDSISTSSSKAVDDHILLLGCSSNFLGDFPGVVLADRCWVSYQKLRTSKHEADLLRHGLGSHTKPCIVGHPNTFIVF
jgi:hypothetical protein